ncbi:unnamed protein product [marine sediment metagenome]|uniref:Uncharacterized protein n=1 Tax=marine sediment metagenome TaxID=412755 RepID=X1GUP3_9ZZZZ
MILDIISSGLLAVILYFILFIVRKIICIDEKIIKIKDNDLPHLFKYTYRNWKAIKKLKKRLG